MCWQLKYKCYLFNNGFPEYYPEFALSARQILNICFYKLNLAKRSIF